jgi:hypothetical protein
VNVAPLTRVAIPRSGVTRTGGSADGYRMIDAGGTRAHGPLSLLELGLVTVVLGIAVGVAVPEYLDLRQQAKDDAAKARLTQASRALEHRHSVAGTYAGAALPAGVELRSAGRRAYCVETTADGRAWHVARGSKPTSGVCLR